MRFLDKYSESTVRAFITIIGLYCAFVITTAFVQIMFTDRMTIDDCVWVGEYNGVKADTGLFIVGVEPGGVADIAGIKNGDRLIKINDRLILKLTDSQKILNEYGNETITYTIVRDGITQDYDIWVYKFFNTQFLIFFLLGGSFLFVGYLVGYSKPKVFVSQLFFLLGASAIGLLVFAPVYYPAIESGEFILYNYLISYAFFPALLVHFVLTYPIQYKFKHRQFILSMIYFISLLPVVIPIISEIFFGNNFNLFRFFANFISYIYIFSAIIIFLISYTKIDNPAQKKSLGIILKGLILGGIGLAYYLYMSFVVNQVFFLVDPLYFAPLLLVLAIPFGFGYSIFKYRVLDTEFIVKKGLVFGILTTFIIAAYLLIVYLLNSLLSNYLFENRQLLTIATIVIITLTFDYVNTKAREFVDRQFYKERYNYRKSLLSFSQELPYLNNANDMLIKLSNSVHESMGIKEFNVLIFNTRYEKLINKDYGKKFTSNSDVESSIYSDTFEKLFKEKRSPQILSEANLSELNISDEQKTAIRQAKTVLAIPIFFKGEVIGSLNFGEKPSGKAYSDEDIDLLKTLASQSAIAFENARLQAEEINKQRIEKELIVARDIQNSLLPKEKLVDERIELSWLNKPAKYIGGDFYDVIKVDDDKYLVVVADVSGKGIPAALYMSKVQAMIQLAAKVFKTPREILIEVNKQVFGKFEKNSFVTVIAALFDFKENKVKIARAGHNPALYSQNGTIEILKNKGIGLGVGDQQLFEKHLDEQELIFTPNNLFVLYSDGLTEAMNSTREEFGISRLLDTLKIVRYDSSDKIVDSILDSVQGFTKDAAQHDDITLVIVKTR